MNIQEAVKELESGKVIHCPNSFETMKTKPDDLGTRVVATRKMDSGVDEEQIMYLTRFEQLYKNCTFGLGPYKDIAVKPAPEKEAK